jgi:hypothetical protein
MPSWTPSICRGSCRCCGRWTSHRRLCTVTSPATSSSTRGCPRQSLISRRTGVQRVRGGHRRRRRTHVGGSRRHAAQRGQANTPHSRRSRCRRRVAHVADRRERTMTNQARLVRRPPWLQHANRGYVDREPDRRRSASAPSSVTGAPRRRRPPTRKVASNIARTLPRARHSMPPPLSPRGRSSRGTQGRAAAACRRRGPAGAPMPTGVGRRSRRAHGAASRADPARGYGRVAGREQRPRLQPACLRAARS